MNIYKNNLRTHDQLNLRINLTFIKVISFKVTKPSLKFIKKKQAWALNQKKSLTNNLKKFQTGLRIFGHWIWLKSKSSWTIQTTF